MARSINLVILIGNLTRDPELRYTPQGHAVVTFGLATNKVWIADGEKKESVEFHNIVACNKLSELCNQLLAKGRKAYIQGRLQTRSWEGQDGVKRTRTEVVATDMVILDNKFKTQPGGAPIASAPSTAPAASPVPASSSSTSSTLSDDIVLDDIEIDKKESLKQKQENAEQGDDEAKNAKGDKGDGDKGDDNEKKKSGLPF